MVVVGAAGRGQANGGGEARGGGRGRWAVGEMAGGCARRRKTSCAAGDTHGDGVIDSLWMDSTGDGHGNLVVPLADGLHPLPPPSDHSGRPGEGDGSGGAGGGGVGSDARAGRGGDATDTDTGVGGAVKVADESCAMDEASLCAICLCERGWPNFHAPLFSAPPPNTHPAPDANAHVCSPTPAAA